MSATPISLPAGKVTQVIGPVVDVHFPPGALPRRPRLRDSS